MCSGEGRRYHTYNPLSPGSVALMSLLNLDFLFSHHLCLLYCELCLLCPLPPMAGHSSPPPQGAPQPSPHAPHLPGTTPPTQSQPPPSATPPQPSPGMYQVRQRTTNVLQTNGGNLLSSSGSPWSALFAAPPRVPWSTHVRHSRGSWRSSGAHLHGARGTPSPYR